MDAAVLDRLVKKMTPRLSRYVVHRPFPKQSAFLLLKNFEAFYGGAAGAAKSDAMLMAAAQYMDVPGYAALIVRRTFTEASLPGALLDRAKEWWLPLGCRYDASSHIFTSPEGAKVTIGFLKSEEDKRRYDGAEFHRLICDESTRFSETQYTHLLGRLRTPACPACEGQKHLIEHPKYLRSCRTCRDFHTERIHLPSAHVPVGARLASNPGGIGHAWHVKRFMNPKTREDRAFVPASLKDNPYIKFEEYVASLMQLNPIDRERRLNGDWTVNEMMQIFRIAKVKLIDAAPANHRRIRYWDMAASQRKVGNLDPDWTAGALVGFTPGSFCVADVQHFRCAPAEVERRIRQTALMDGPGVDIYIEEEPGSAGISLVDHYKRNVLMGFAVYGDRPTGDKLSYASPLASAMDADMVSMVIGEWNDVVLTEMELFMQGQIHDDTVDACSKGYRILTLGPPPLVVSPLRIR